MCAATSHERSTGTADASDETIIVGRAAGPKRLNLAALTLRKLAARLCFAAEKAADWPKVRRGWVVHGLAMSDGFCGWLTPREQQE